MYIANNINNKINYGNFFLMIVKERSQVCCLQFQQTRK